MPIEKRAESKHVYFVTDVMMHYRAPFHNRLRDALRRKDIAYSVIYSSPSPINERQKDTIDLDWGVCVPCHRTTISGIQICWQSVSKHVLNADLVIIGQESRYLHNYLLIALRYLNLIKRIAFFGHGRNFQSEDRGFKYRLKQKYSLMVDWWFCYTDLSLSAIRELGFDSDRTTVVNNTIDTADLEKDIASISAEELLSLRSKNNIGLGPIGLFIGALHKYKRLQFLIDAACEVRKRIPTFELVIAGDGFSKDLVLNAAAQYDWIHVVPPTFGREKAMLLCCASCVLVPGLVGLVAIDAIVAGVPLVTTSYRYHSPEVAYIVAGETGVIVENYESIYSYADAVIKLITDGNLCEKPVGARGNYRNIYTIDSMVSRFEAGIIAALNLEGDAK